MIELEHYESLRSRPSGMPVLNMKWRDLAFLHFSADPDEVQRLLPGGLTVDTYEGRAWIGVVSFLMKDTRPNGLPPVPTASDFPEFNVRTYVHREGLQPGVWFFSLDAGSWLASQTARATFGLPYYHSDMTLRRENDVIEYTSLRKDGSGAKLRGQVVCGREIHHAEPGTLEFFLIERYLLYSVQLGKLVSARVFHSPYPLQECEVTHLETNLTDVIGLPWRPWEHTVFSGGVDVDAFAPKAV